MLCPQANLAVLPDGLYNLNEASGLHPVAKLSTTSEHQLQHHTVPVGAVKHAVQRSPNTIPQTFVRASTIKLLDTYQRCGQKVRTKQCVGQQNNSRVCCVLNALLMLKLVEKYTYVCFDTEFIIFPEHLHI